MAAANRQKMGGYMVGSKQIKKFLNILVVFFCFHGSLLNATREHTIPIEFSLQPIQTICRTFNLKV
jgi:hypothetical protein